MATNFQPKGDIEVYVATGSALLDTQHDAGVGGDTWEQLLVTDFSINQASAPVEVAPPRASTYGQTESMGHHRPDTQMYEASLTMRGTPTAIETSCLALFGDGASPCELSPASNTGTMKDGVSNSSAVTLLFKGAGADSINVDIVMKSCFATSVALKEDVGSNGGELTVEATFVSAYRPTENASITPSVTSLDSATPKNIFSLSTKTLDSQELMITSWELTMARSLDRVSFQDTTDYDPFGYVQTAPYEVTGSISCKRDDNVENIFDHIKGDSTGIELSLAESSGFTVACDDVMIEDSKPEVGEYLTQTIPFRAFGADESSNIVSITVS